MRLLIYLFLLVSMPIVLLGDENNLPFSKENLQATYKLNNGNIVYIEQYERGDRIWEKDISTGKIHKVSFVWNFIALAQNCESIKEENIYFAVNLEYYLGGGNNLDNPQIRIFSLHDPSPWRDSDLGIVPNMEWTEQWCVFYNQIK